MGDAGFWRRLGYETARLGSFLGFCMLEWWLLPGFWSTPYFALFLAGLASQTVFQTVVRWTRVADPSVQSEWLWPVPGWDGPPGTLEIRMNEDHHRRLGARMVYGGLTLLVFATIGAMVQAWWFGSNPTGFYLGIGLAILLMTRGMIWSLQDLSSPLVTVDVRGLKTYWNTVSWASVACCEIRTELNLRGQVTNIYPVFHTAPGLRIPMNLRGDFSVATAEERERILAFLRVRFVKMPTAEAVS